MTDNNKQHLDQIDQIVNCKCKFKYAFAAQCIEVEIQFWVAKPLSLSAILYAIFFADSQ